MISCWVQVAQYLKSYDLTTPRSLLSPKVLLVAILCFATGIGLIAFKFLHLAPLHPLVGASFQVQESAAVCHLHRTCHSSTCNVLSGAGVLRRRYTHYSMWTPTATGWCQRRR